MSVPKTVKLNNGLELPTVGLGTYSEVSYRRNLIYFLLNNILFSLKKVTLKKL